MLRVGAGYREHDAGCLEGITMAAACLPLCVAAVRSCERISKREQG